MPSQTNKAPKNPCTPSTDGILFGSRNSKDPCLSPRLCFFPPVCPSVSKSQSDWQRATTILLLIIEAQELRSASFGAALSRFDNRARRYHVRIWEMSGFLTNERANERRAGRTRSRSETLDLRKMDLPHRKTLVKRPIQRLGMFAAFLREPARRSKDSNNGVIRASVVAFTICFAPALWGSFHECAMLSSYRLGAQANTTERAVPHGEHFYDQTFELPNSWSYSDE